MACLWTRSICNDAIDFTLVGRILALVDWKHGCFDHAVYAWTVPQGPFLKRLNGVLQFHFGHALKHDGLTILVQARANGSGRFSVTETFFVQQHAQDGGQERIYKVGQFVSIGTKFEALLGTVRQENCHVQGGYEKLNRSNDKIKLRCQMWGSNQVS